MACMSPVRWKPLSKATMPDFSWAILNIRQWKVLQSPFEKCVWKCDLQHSDNCYDNDDNNNVRIHTHLYIFPKAWNKNVLLIWRKITIGAKCETKDKLPKRTSSESQSANVRYAILNAQIYRQWASTERYQYQSLTSLFLYRQDAMIIMTRMQTYYAIFEPRRCFLLVLLNSLKPRKNGRNFVCDMYFNHIKSFITSRIAGQMYFTIIKSRISDGIEVYGPCADEHLSKLQTLQNKLLKHMLKLDRRTFTNQLHPNLSLL